MITSEEQFHYFDVPHIHSLISCGTVCLLRQNVPVFIWYALQTPNNISFLSKKKILNYWYRDSKSITFCVLSKEIIVR